MNGGGRRRGRAKARKNKVAQCKLERYRLWMVYRGARLGSTSASTDKRGKRSHTSSLTSKCTGETRPRRGKKGERDESIAGTEIDTLFRHTVSGYTPSIRIRSKLLLSRHSAKSIVFFLAQFRKIRTTTFFRPRMWRRKTRIAIVLEKILNYITYYKYIKIIRIFEAI